MSQRILLKPEPLYMNNFKGNSSQIMLAEQSYSRCLANGDLITRFYEIFLKSSKEIEEHFSNTNFVSQKKVLHHGILCLILFAKGSLAGAVTVEKIAHTHKKSLMNVKPELYPLWKHCLMTVIAEFDEDFNDDIAQGWSLVLDHGIEFIILGYLK